MAGVVYCRRLTPVYIFVILLGVLNSSLGALLRKAYNSKDREVLESKSGFRNTFGDAGAVQNFVPNFAGQIPRLLSFIEWENAKVVGEKLKRKSFNLLRKHSTRVQMHSSSVPPAPAATNSIRFVERRSQHTNGNSAAMEASAKMAMEQSAEAKQGLFLGSGVRAPAGAMQLVNTPFGRRMGFTPVSLAQSNRFVSVQQGMDQRSLAQVEAVLPPTSPPPPAMLDQPPLPPGSWGQRL
jgi:hypothetical protein